MTPNIFRNIANKATALLKKKAGEAPVQKIANDTEKFVKEKVADVKRDFEPVSEENWYRKSAQACESVSDALLREEKGASKRIVKGIAGKLGFAGFHL